MVGLPTRTGATVYALVFPLKSASVQTQSLLSYSHRTVARERFSITALTNGRTSWQKTLEF